MDGSAINQIDDSKRQCKNIIDNSKEKQRLIMSLEDFESLPLLQVQSLMTNFVSALQHFL